MVSEDNKGKACTLKPQSLNPCFNGIWSLSSGLIQLIGIEMTVLILVLMEYGL